jgi:hypothetical protein
MREGGKERELQSKDARLELKYREHGRIPESTRARATGQDKELGTTNEMREPKKRERKRETFMRGERSQLTGPTAGHTAASQSCQSQIS